MMMMMMITLRRKEILTKFEVDTRFTDAITCLRLDVYSEAYTNCSDHFRLLLATPTQATASRIRPIAISIAVVIQLLNQFLAE